MQHDDWHAAMKKLMDSAETTNDDWEALLRKTEHAARTSVGYWHVQQTLELYAIFLRDNGDPEAASELYQRVAADADEQLRYWHAASATSLAYAALDGFNNADPTRAVDLAKRALKHFGHSAEPPFPVFEELIAQMRTHLENQAREGST